MEEEQGGKVFPFFTLESGGNRNIWDFVVLS